MKRLWAVAIASLLSLSAMAQIRGIPPSVTSVTPMRTTSGIPASVTSLGPNGYGNRRDFGRSFNNNFNSMCSTGGALIPSAMGCTSTYFTNSMYGLPLNTPPTNLRSRGHRARGGAVYPVYVPYTVPVVVEEVPEPQPDMSAIGDTDSEEPPALTVFEHRSKSAVTPAPVPIDQSRVYHPGMTEPPAAKPEPQAPPILLIYKDGRQREVQNYAIMGNYLYDLGTFVAQKIPLAELNLKATVKANDERGVDFALPAGVTP